MFQRTFQAGWGDMDFNAHMANTAYLNRAADVRMLFFAEHGFPMSEFRRRRLGPVIMKDEIEYHREIALLETFTVDLQLAGLAPDGSRFLLHNELCNSSGKRCARVISAGGWLDLEARRLVAAPAELLAAMHAMTRTEHFQELPSSLKSAG